MITEKQLDEFIERGKKLNFATQNAYIEGARSLKPIVLKLAQCWDDIPNLDGSAEGFNERLFKDRMLRVSKFKEALSEVEKLLEQK